MADLLSAAMLAELQSNSKSAFGVLSVTIGATTYRYAGGPVSSTSLGQFHGKVQRWGRGARTLSNRDGGLQLANYSVTIEDTARVFSALVEGSTALRGSAVTVQVASLNVAAASWFTWFSGTLDTYRMDSPHVWTLTFQSNQQQLRQGKFPKTPVLQIDFPNVDDKAIYGTWVPLIYGVHDSRGSGDAGIIPCPYVDTIAFRYLVAHGWVTCDRVYSDGVLKTVTTDYTVTHPTINGRLYTLIDFVAEQVDGSGNPLPITADVTGYEATGDGTGATLTGTNALKHLLSNFIYGDYQGGNWGSDTTAVNTTHFTSVQTILTNQGLQKASKRFGGTAQTLGMDAVNSFCRSLRCEAFWTSAGKLALAWNNPADLTLWYDDERHLRYDRDEVGAFSLEWDRTRLTDRVGVDFLYDSVKGQFVQKLEVRDESSTEDILTNLQLEWSHGSLL